MWPYVILCGAPEAARSTPTWMAGSSSSGWHGRDGGRPGGYRAIVLFRRGERCFFVYGFAKSDRANIRRDELKAFRLLAEEMLGMDDVGLRAALSDGTIWR